MEKRELQWANPSTKFPLPEALTRALVYLRILLSSKDHTQWISLCQKLTEPHGPEYSIAPRWRILMCQDSDSIPDRPSPLAVDNAAKQLSIASSLSERATSLAGGNNTHRSRIVLNIFAKGKARAPRGHASAKRLRPTNIEPLRVAMPLGTKRPSNKYCLATSRDASNITVARLG